MGQYVEVITYKGKEIIYLNLEGLDEGNQIKAMDEADKIFAMKDNILNINNITNTITTPAVKERAKTLTDKYKNQIKGQVIVGVSGLKRMIAQGINKDMYFAKSLDDAKEWLVQQ